jgi:hypothetical protein
MRLALALLSLSLAVGVAAAGEPLTEEHVNASLARFIKDIHRVDMTVTAGGPALLVHGLTKPGAFAPDSMSLVLHGKAETASGFRGDVALALQGVTAPKKDQAESQPSSTNGSVIFRTEEAMPATVGQATDLFDRVVGCEGRAGLMGGRSFTKGDDGAWWLMGEWKQPAGADGAPGTHLRAVLTIGPDRDGPQYTLVGMYSEAVPLAAR